MKQRTWGYAMLSAPLIGFLGWAAYEELWGFLLAIAGIVVFGAWLTLALSLITDESDHEM